MIGIFDSGIGGASVLKEIIKLLPNYHYVYYSDSIRHPYGDKTQKELYSITEHVVNYLISIGCQVIVIACNTASSICKDYLRSKFSIPIVAIEPAIKLVNNNENTLIMATKGTISSEHFIELYQKYNNQHMRLLSCSGLADLIEDNNLLEIQNYLRNNLIYSDIHNVVLGCTHYPFIKKEIVDVLGNVNFYDGGIGVAKRLKEVVHSISLQEEVQKIDFIDSSKSLKKEERFWDFMSNLSR